MQILKLLLCTYISVSVLTKMEAQVKAPVSSMLLETEDLSVNLVSSDDHYMFVSAHFERVEQNLVIRTHETIHSILMYDENDNLEFLLPVNATSVNLGRSLFSDTTYRLAFNFSDKEDLVSATLAMK